MNLPRLGHAIIVNNIASEMPGSLRDVDALKEAYETVGFDVQVHNDCGEKVLYGCLKVIVESDEDNYNKKNEIAK